MTSNLNHGILVSAGLAGFVLAICITGCGSVPDGGFTPFTGSGYHPFGDDQQHGEYIKANPGSLAACTECHGSDLHGVDNGVVGNGENDRSCYKCHRAEHHIIGFDDATQHPAYLTQHGWDLTECYVCHTNIDVNDGVDFGGSCRAPGCHTASSIGPQACNTCHGNPEGNPALPSTWAPPEDLAGNESGNFASIGAHQAHVAMAGRNFKPVGCHVCHVQPASWDSPGHILNDNTPSQAEVVLSFPATVKSFNAQYDRNSATCSSTYCHGGQTASWTDGGDWASCTSCHGMPPGGTHYNWQGIEAQCYWCHGSVINAAGVIIAPQLHVDGYVSMN